MATIKSFSDLQQSKKLAEILPIDSADMQWFLEEDYGIVQIKEGLQDWGGDCTIPCWSLTALLNILPSGYVIVKNYHSLYYVESRDHGKSTNIFNNPVDACVAMIERLNELKML